MYHYQFQTIWCMQLEMIYAIFIIGKIPTSRCRHLRYVNEQITPHFWLFINNMYHVAQEWQIDFMQKRIILFHKTQNSVTSIIIFGFVLSISLNFNVLPKSYPTFVYVNLNQFRETQENIGVRDKNKNIYIDTWKQR